MARHIEAVVDPDHADEVEGKAILREERAALDKTNLRISPRFDGSARISGIIPEAAAHRLRTYLEAYAQPRRLEGEVLRSDQRMGRAFCDLLERIDPHGLPQHGGDATTVMVTIPLADLRSDLSGASLGGIDSDVRLSASEARRLACAADIIPAVLGAKSQVLDLGRSQRLFSPRSARPSALVTAPARSKAATSPPPGATPITKIPGLEVVVRISRTRCSCVDITIDGSTMTATHPPSQAIASRCIFEGDRSVADPDASAGSLRVSAAGHLHSAIGIRWQTAKCGAIELEHAAAARGRRCLRP